MSTPTPGTSAPAPTSPTTDRIAHLRTFYAARLADSKAELTKAEKACDSYARCEYQGRIAAFTLILADLTELQEGCRHA